MPPDERPAALFYDAANRRVSEAEIAWYRARLPRDAGTLLAAMAGSGRLLLPLIEAGLRIHGVDSSASMLARCAARCRAAGVDIELFRQDIATLNLPFRYAAAFIAGGALQLLAPSSARDALARLRAHLVDPAVLLLDLCVPDAARHPPGAPVVEVDHALLSDGSLLVRRSETSTDPERRQLHTTSRYEHRVAGRIVAREDESRTLTWYDEEAAVAMLREEGYRAIRTEPAEWAAARGRRYAVSARA